MSGYRPPYTLEEDKKILQYIIEQKAYYSLRGNTFWKQIEDNNVVDRSWQSAKEHFRKSIINCLNNPHFELSQEEKFNLTEGYNLTSARTQRFPKYAHVVKLRKNAQAKRKENAKQANKSSDSETEIEVDETSTDTSDSEEELDQSKKQNDNSKNRKFPDLENMSSSSEDGEYYVIPKLRTKNKEVGDANVKSSVSGSTSNNIEQGSLAKKYESYHKCCFKKVAK